MGVKGNITNDSDDVLGLTPVTKYKLNRLISRFYIPSRQKALDFFDEKNDFSNFCKHLRNFINIRKLVLLKKLAILLNNFNLFHSIKRVRFLQKRFYECL